MVEFDDGMFSSKDDPKKEACMEQLKQTIHEQVLESIKQSARKNEDIYKALAGDVEATAKMKQR